MTADYRKYQLITMLQNPITPMYKKIKNNIAPAIKISQ